MEHGSFDDRPGAARAEAGRRLHGLPNGILLACRMRDSSGARDRTPLCHRKCEVKWVCRLGVGHRGASGGRMPGLDDGRRRDPEALEGDETQSRRPI
jgi:hypothetical protein